MPDLLSVSLQGTPQVVSNINACQAVADAVRTTLGPAGRDKLIATNKVTISNDGATIMRLLEIEHPAAKTLVDISISQDIQVGDGTTSVVLLAAEILTRLKPLVEEGLHPQILMRHLRAASQLAVETIEKLTVKSTSEEQLQEMLFQTARTSLNSKLIANHQDLFAPMVVEAVQTLHKASTDKNSSLLDQMDQWINISKIPGGDVRQSFLVHGVAFPKTFSYAGFDQMKKRFENPKILLLNVELELKAEKENAEVRISDPDQYQAIVDAEWQVIYDKLQACVDCGANIVLSQLPVGDLATQFFLDRGMFAAGRVPPDDLKRVAKATGASIQTTTNGLVPKEGDGPRAQVLGTCGLFEERQVGDGRFNVFTDCPVKLTTTLVLRGGTEQFIAESERSLNDALQVVRRSILHPSVVAGGGAVEMHLSTVLKEHALTIKGKGQLIVSAFSKALEVIPRQLCDNAGLDATDLVADLRRKHYAAVVNDKSHSWFGVDLNEGVTCDMMKKGVWEPAANKMNSLSSATEAACLILSIDETVVAPPSQDPAAGATGMMANSGMGGGGGGMSQVMTGAMQAAQSGGARKGQLGPGVSYMKGRGGA